MRYIEAKIMLANPELEINDTNSNGEIAIISPIPRGYTMGGVPIYESNKSCSYKRHGRDDQPVLIDYSNKGYNELSLIKHFEGINNLNASDLAENYINSDKIIDELKVNFKREVLNFKKNNCEAISKKFNWSEKVLKSSKLFIIDNDTFTIPLINNNVVLSFASYYPERATGKWIYTKGVKGALLFNYDDWVYDKRPTYLCEGPKDMLTLLSLGYNAISYSNGALANPKFYKNDFKNREIYIIYDNDEPGQKGALKVASWLFSIAESNITQIKIVDLSPVCIEKGEDIFDYFNKYKKTQKEFDTLIKNTQYFTQMEYIKTITEKYPSCSIQEARTSSNLNKVFQTDIMIIAEENDKNAIVEDKFEILYKWETISGDKVLSKNVEVTHQEELFNYMKPRKIQREKKLSCIRGYTANKKEFEIIDIIPLSTVWIYCYTVTSMVKGYTAIEDSDSSKSYLCYSIDKPLEINSSYKISYKVTAHPDNKSEPLILILDTFCLSDIDSEFILTPGQFTALKVFRQSSSETVTMAIEKKFTEAQMYLGYDVDKQKNLWLSNELLFHSVYKYTEENGEVQRGLLVALIFGDWGFGKSYIYRSLSKLYEKGTFITGNNITEAGLLGGSAQRSNGERRIVPGIVTQNHKGYLILEEFTTATVLLEKMTDLITSGQARITRVGESITYTASARWLFISNTLSGRKLKDYKHGMIPYKELIKRGEWARRFDLVLAVSTDDIKNANNGGILPSARQYKETFPYAKELYQLKVKWVWTRSSKNIVLSANFQDHVFLLGQKWLETYGDRVEIVGNIARNIAIKLSRLAIACAGLLFSTIDGINLIVTTEHANWAYQFLVGIYDNTVFNLKEFVALENKYRLVYSGDVKILQSIWKKDSHFLEVLSELDYPIRSFNELKSLSSFSEDNRTWHEIHQKLVKNHFVKLTTRGVELTDKFHTAYKQLDTSNPTVVQEFEYNI